MRWYVNDLSLQGQFQQASEFEPLLAGLVVARNRFDALRASLHTTRSFPDREVVPHLSLRELLRQAPYRDLRGAVMAWLDKTGPFIDEDRQPEPDDYFEYDGHDVTERGLGEAARRMKAGDNATTFSFPGGRIDFARTPLCVEHGIAEDRLGAYDLNNVWSLNDLEQSAINQRPLATNWQQLVESARELFPRLTVPDSVYKNVALAREPFEASIRDRAMALFHHLNEFMAGRNADGSHGSKARAVIDQHFVGDRALFTAESLTNQNAFKKAMTFADPHDATRTIFAHWHGKISHRFFRMHFEWPVPTDVPTLKVLYFGPKITKG